MVITRYVNGVPTKERELAKLRLTDPRVLTIVRRVEQRVNGPSAMESPKPLQNNGDGFAASGVL